MLRNQEEENNKVEQAKAEMMAKHKEVMAEKRAIAGKKDQQKKQFEGMIKKIESGEVAPNEFMDYEICETPSLIGDGITWERRSLANKLIEARKKKQRDKAEEIITAKILEEREIKEKRGSLTKEEEIKLWGKMNEFLQE